MGVSANGKRAYLGGDENILTLDIGDGTVMGYIWEYTKNYWIVHFKWINIMVYELYLGKIIFK